MGLAAAPGAGAAVQVRLGAGLGFTPITSTYYSPSLLFPDFFAPPPYLGAPLYPAPYAISPLGMRPWPAYFSLPLRKDSSARQRAAQPRPAGAAASGERFYLERQAAPRGEPEGLLSLVGKQLRVEMAGDGRYLVRWAGPAAEARSVEIQSVDDKGQLLHSRLLKALPFSGILEVTPETMHVVLILESRSGGGATFKIPVGQFRGLAP